jgi:hypothetical protein
MKNLSDFVDDSFDVDFANIANRNYLPWIGKDYIKAPINLLIVGESHYLEKDNTYHEAFAQETWTREFIFQDGLRNEADYTGRPNILISNTEKLLRNAPVNEKFRNKLWCSVAYMNIIQTLLPSIKHRPQHVDKLNGRSVFLQVVKLIQPDYCLFLGVETCGYFSTNLTKENDVFVSSGITKFPKIQRVFPRTVILTDTLGKSIKVLFIKHPSSLFPIFDPNLWLPFLDIEMGDYTTWLKDETS